jgi:hypothetical protein
VGGRSKVHRPFQWVAQGQVLCRIM